eukprot:7299825-Prymnesium_polylepis.1
MKPWPSSDALNAWRSNSSCSWEIIDLCRSMRGMVTTSARKAETHACAVAASSQRRSINPPIAVATIAP